MLNLLQYFVLCSFLHLLTVYPYLCTQRCVGTFDQTLGNINTLYSMQGKSEYVELFLVMEDSIIFLLKPVSSSDALIAYLLTSFASAFWFLALVYLLTRFASKVYLVLLYKQWNLLFIT